MVKMLAKNELEHPDLKLKTIQEQCKSPLAEEVYGVVYIL